MNITLRAYRDENDTARMVALARRQPLEYPHAIALPYRLSAIQRPETATIALWQGDDGELLAFTHVHEHWRALDYAIHPRIDEHLLAEPLMLWIAELLDRRAARGQPQEPLFIDVADHNTTLLAMLARNGFVPAANRASIYLRHLNDVIPTPGLPAGWEARPLREADLAAAVLLASITLGSAAIPMSWRRRMMRSSAYLPALDILVTAADGSPAAFSIGWLDARSGIGQIEPLGIHPQHRGIGLSRSLVLDMLWRLQAHGATTALVTPFEDDHSAIRLYTAFGFELQTRFVTLMRMG